MAKPIPMSRKIFLAAKKEKESILKDSSKKLEKVQNKTPEHIIIKYIDCVESVRKVIIVSNEEQKIAMHPSKVRHIIIAA